jgi:predicted RNA-binding Zn-ribbon protein involved in translation (DUF1610 family)
MGCYDTVMVPCPSCGNREPFQTKSGECSLEEYDLENAPDLVLGDVNRHAPYNCQKCGALFYVKSKIVAISALWTEANDLDIKGRRSCG